MTCERRLDSVVFPKTSGKSESAAKLYSSFCRKWDWGGRGGLRRGNRQWTRMNANGRLRGEARAVVFSSFCRNSLRSALRALLSAPLLYSSLCRKWEWGGRAGLGRGNRQWTRMNAYGRLRGEARAGVFRSFGRISLRSALSALLSAPLLFSSFCRKWDWGGQGGLTVSNRQWTRMNANGGLRSEARAGVFSSFGRISLRSALCTLLSAPLLFSSFCQKTRFHAPVRPLECGPLFFCEIPPFLPGYPDLNPSR